MTRRVHSHDRQRLKWEEPNFSNVVRFRVDISRANIHTGEDTNENYTMYLGSLVVPIYKVNNSRPR